ncbi:chemotaxis protein CheB [Dactylosporangium aurantiacum]|uniref:protein-glutamate methylesterase n=1 Tax=Dactylosporangium aurantiacum TaxID=35754 RepID=A0A9Q9IS76_9ACTN|nr:chemotaxis protein CheB [Dactylosporangium aurantiacum]MDG6105780.1 chemotaxis protein CheB [Dactylosporangium aurantiacum]UWZ58033.1 chemotaxis protein CheB [Dactylosporangium aurantiacum]
MDTFRRDVVVIGGSAGGHDAAQRLVAGLPAELGAAVLVALHLSPSAPSTLGGILARAGRLPAAPAKDGEQALPGRIYAAVPDHHLLIGERDLLHHSRGPRQNRARPAADTLFRSAARWCGSRVIGVVLSGSLDDGAAGLSGIVERGGVALVQRPDDARFDGMPAAALSAVPDATALPARDLGPAIAELVGRSDAPDTPAQMAPTDSLLWETEMLADGRSTIDRPGRPVALGCPDCGGGMYRLDTGHAIHYACHVGHSYSPQTLLAARDDNVEAALWAAVSALQEKAMVLRELAQHAAGLGDEAAHRRHHDAAEQAWKAGEVLRTQLG